MAQSAVTVVNAQSLSRLRKAFGVVSQNLRERFENKIAVQARLVLLKNARKYAGEMSRSGDLVRGIKIKRGGLGAGRSAISLQVSGPAAAYANILNTGGVIRPKRVQHLTEPLRFAQDPATGKKIKPLTAYDDKDTFTWNRPGAKFGRLADKKVVFFRQKERIIPLFVLTKEKRIKATNWADNAMRDTLAEIEPILRQAAEDLLSRRTGRGRR